MNVVRKLISVLRGKPLTPEEAAARAEARAVRDEVLNERLSQRSSASQIYQSGRGRDE